MSPSVPDADQDAAADLFAKAVETCDPEMIREAVSRGARIDELPGTRVTPFEVALNKLRFEPRAEECIATLVELGFPIDGRPDRTPTVLGCTASQRDEEDALRMLKVVVPLGANVNAVAPSSGNTALFEAVVQGWRTIIEYLRDYGADPTIKNSRGISAIDWLQERIADSGRMLPSEQGRGWSPRIARPFRERLANSPGRRTCHADVRNT